MPLDPAHAKPATTNRSMGLSSTDLRMQVVSAPFRYFQTSHQNHPPPRPHHLAITTYPKPKPPTHQNQNLYQAEPQPPTHHLPIINLPNTQPPNPSPDAPESPTTHDHHLPTTTIATHHLSAPKTSHIAPTHPPTPPSRPGKTATTKAHASPSARARSGSRDRPHSLERGGQKGGVDTSFNN
jgi:hypothetical protein